MGGEKKKSDSKFLSYNLMLNSGKKNRALRNNKNKYSTIWLINTKCDLRDPSVVLFKLVSDVSLPLANYFFSNSPCIPTFYLYLHNNGLGKHVM
jgi:hypothetical protein